MAEVLTPALAGNGASTAPAVPCAAGRTETLCRNNDGEGQGAKTGYTEYNFTE
jgi:hypothetical protein